MTALFTPRIAAYHCHTLSHLSTAPTHDPTHLFTKKSQNERTEYQWVIEGVCIGIPVREGYVGPGLFSS